MLSVSPEQCFLLAFVRFPVKAYDASIFLNKHIIDMFDEFLFSLGDFGKQPPALPIHYTVFDIFGPLKFFFQILHVGVALGKAPILTQFLVKQTKFALVRRPTPFISPFSKLRSFK